MILEKTVGGERREQYAPEIYFYKNRFEDLFEISFSIFLFLKTDLQKSKQES
jgi:hypothetical protein